MISMKKLDDIANSNATKTRRSDNKNYTTRWGKSDDTLLEAGTNAVAERHWKQIIYVDEY